MATLLDHCHRKTHAARQTWQQFFEAARNFAQHAMQTHPSTDAGSSGRFQLRRSSFSPLQELVHQGLVLLRTTPTLRDVEHRLTTSPAQDGSTDEHRAAQCRWTLVVHLLAAADGLLVKAQEVEREDHAQKRRLRGVKLPHAKPVGSQVVLELFDALLGTGTLVVVAPQRHGGLLAIGDEDPVSVARHLNPVPVHDAFEFPYWYSFYGGRVCEIYELHTQNQFAEHHTIGGKLARVRAVSECPSLKERVFGVLLMLSSHEVNTNDEYELEETKVVSLTIPAGATESAPLEVTLEPEEGRDFQVTAHEISFETPETEPPEFSSGNIFAATTDDVSSVTDQGSPSGSQPGGVTSMIEVYDPGAVNFQKAQELKIAKMEGRADKDGIFLGPPVLPPLNPPAAKGEPLATVANRQLCIPEHDSDRFRVRVSGVRFDPEGINFVLKLQTLEDKIAEHDPKPLKMKKDGHPNGGAEDYVSEWQLLVSDATDDQHATHRWPRKYEKEGWRMEVTYTAAQIPVFKWINKEDGREEIAVPETSPEDQTHMAALGSKVTIKGETIAAGKSTANGKVDFDKPVEGGREVKMKVAYAWDVGPQQVFEQIFAQDFKRAKESLAQAGIRLTLVGSPIKIEKPASVTNTELMKMIQHMDKVANRHNPELLELINAAWTNGNAPASEPDCIQVIYIRSLSDEGAPKNKMDTSGMAFAPFFINGGTASPEQSKYPMPKYVNNIFISTNRVERDAGGNPVGIAGLGKPFTLAHEIGHILTDMGHYGTPKAEAGSVDYIFDAPVYLRDHNLMRRGTSEYDYFHESRRLYFLQDEILMKHPNNPNHNKFK